MNEKKLSNKSVLTIAVCWLVYTCSYSGKSDYNANIILMPDKNNTNRGLTQLPVAKMYDARRDKR